MPFKNFKYYFMSFVLRKKENGCAFEPFYLYARRVTPCECSTYWVAISSPIAPTAQSTMPFR